MVCATPTEEAQHRLLRWKWRRVWRGNEKTCKRAHVDLVIQVPNPFVGGSLVVVDHTAGSLPIVHILAIFNMKEMHITANADALIVIASQQ